MLFLTLHFYFMTPNEKRFDRPERRNGTGRDGNKSDNRKTDGSFKPARRSFNDNFDKYSGRVKDGNRSDRFSKNDSDKFPKRDSDRFPKRDYDKFNRDEDFKPRLVKKNSDGETPRPSYNRFEKNDGLKSYKETRFDGNKKMRHRSKVNDDNKAYDPNDKYSKKKQLEYKKQMTSDGPVRLNKFLANAGFCSRREADEYIKAGVVTVNGEVVTEMGSKVNPGDKVLFHDQLVRSERKVYVLLNKPKDCVTTTEDANARLTVMDLVKNACNERIYPVGRLDRNTTGVLLLTNDGDLAAKLMHPKFEKKKIYHAYLDKALDKNDLETIAKGIDLDDGFIKADSINYVEDDDKKQIGIEIHSGRNRLVRRIFEKVGYKVLRLDRVFFAGLTKKNLSRGQWRHLSEKEVNMLRMGAFE
jgi:23S rRNA pseudouridine2605 synthase